MTNMEGGEDEVVERSPRDEIFAHNPELAAIDTEHGSDDITVNESGMIESGGDLYYDSPRMRDFVRLASAVRASLPPVADGSVRLWRGNRPDEVGHNPSYTNSLEGIALPFLASYGGVLSYIDVSEDEARAYVHNGATAKDAEFILPPEITKTATIVGFSAEDALEIKNNAKPQREDLPSAPGMITVG